MAATFIICRTASKLKHVASTNLLSTYKYVPYFSYASWNKCSCYKYSGCPLKPLHRKLSGERNFCFVCSVRVTYNIDKIYKLQKTSDIINTYWEIKEDL